MQHLELQLTYSASRAYLVLEEYINRKLRHLEMKQLRWQDMEGQTRHNLIQKEDAQRFILQVNFMLTTLYIQENTNATELE